MRGKAPVVGIIQGPVPGNDGLRQEPRGAVLDNKLRQWTRYRQARQHLQQGFKLNDGRRHRDAFGIDAVRGKGNRGLKVRGTDAAPEGVGVGKVCGLYREVFAVVGLRKAR